MMDRHQDMELADRILALPGITVLYSSPAVADMAQSLLDPARELGSPLTITDTAVAVRVGIDHTRSIADVGTAIHRTISAYRQEQRLSSPLQIDIQIATIR